MPVPMRELVPPPVAQSRSGPGRQRAERYTGEWANAVQLAGVPRMPDPSRLARISHEPVSYTLWRVGLFHQSDWQAPGHVSTSPGLESGHSTLDVSPPNQDRRKPLPATRAHGSRCSRQAPVDRYQQPVEAVPELPGVWPGYSGWSGQGSG